MTLKQIRKVRLSLYKVTDQLIHNIASTDVASKELSILCFKHRILSNHINNLTQKETDLLSK